MSTQPDPASRPSRPTQSSDEELLRVHAQACGPSIWLPTFSVFVIAALLASVAVYVDRHSGDFSPLVYNEDAKSLPSATAGSPKPLDPVALGKRLYQGTCVTCHQATGQGLPGVYPPLASSEWVLGSEERLIRVLVHGLSGPVKVAGNNFPGNIAMPAFGKVPGGGYNWRDDQIAAVLTYVRQEWGNKAPAVSSEKVAEIRSKEIRDKAWTASELDSLPSR